MEKKTIKHKTALAYAWSAVRTGVEQVFSFFTFLVLGRLLTPEDFGVVALAAAVVEILRLLSWVGLYETIIRAPVLEDRAADTAFWTSLSLGSLMAAAVVLLAGPIAAFFGQPSLESVITAMSVIVVASTLGVVHTARIARDFGHKLLAMRTLAANIAGGVTAIAVVAAGGGLWALVAQRLAAEIIQTAAVWIASPWVPRLRFSLADLKTLGSFGARMTVVNLVDGINGRIQESLIGSYLPVAAVGALRVASRVCDLIQQLVFMPAHQASMVAFARLQDNPQQLRRGYLMAVRLSGIVGFPCFLALAAVAPSLIPLAFGPHWVVSVPILQALCLAVVPITVQFYLGPMLVAVGRPNALASYSLLSLGLGVLSTLVAVHWGIVAVGLGLSLRTWLLMPLALYLLHDSCRIRPAEVLLAMAQPFAAAALATLPIFLADGWLDASLPRFAVVAVDLSGYLLLYTGLLFLTARRFLAEAAGSVLPIMPVRLQGGMRRLFGLEVTP